MRPSRHGWAHGIPRKGRRDETEPEIVAALEAVGCDVVKLSMPCDLLVGRGGVNYLLEVKSTPRSKLTPDEKRFADWWRGGTVRVVTTPEEALRAVGLRL